MKAERSEAVAAETAGASASSFLEATALKNAVARLRERADPRARALRLTIEPDRVLLQSEDLGAPGTIQQLEYENGRVHGPVRVVLKGSGDLEDNLFDLDQARLEAVPALARAAIARIDPAHGKVDSVVLRRHLPHDDQLRFRVFVESPLMNGQLDGDAEGRPLTGI